LKSDKTDVKMNIFWGWFDW